MTSAERNFLNILKNALHPHTTQSLGAEPYDYEGALKAASRQNLLPLVYNAASEFPGFEEFSKNSGGRYLEPVMRAVGNQMRRTDEFLRLYSAFLAAGIQPIVLKGIVCRALYGENADYRPSGDEDLWVEKEQFAKATEVLAQCGFEGVGDCTDKDLNLVQEVSFKSKTGSLLVELHINPFGFENKLRTKMAKWFENVFQSNETVEVGGARIRTMPKTDCFLFILLHAFKHFTHTGFGVRMIIDTLLYMEQFYSEINWEHIKNALGDVSALGFFGDMIEIGNKYLGFNLPQIAVPVCPEDLLEDTLKTGTFGNLDSAGAVSNRFIDMALNNEGGKSKSKLRDMWQVLFPSWSTWKRMRPHLADKPYLLPAEWFMRVIRFLRHKRRGVVNLSASRELSQQRIELFERYNII